MQQSNGNVVYEAAAILRLHICACIARAGKRLKHLARYDLTFVERSGVWGYHFARK
jgi:hypothetical protein